MKQIVEQNMKFERFFSTNFQHFVDHTVNQLIKNIMDRLFDKLKWLLVAALLLPKYMIEKFVWEINLEFSE